MPYPLSSPVSAGQPTAADHYNHLRSDALHLGQAETDAVDLSVFFKRYAAGIRLERLEPNRLRVPYISSNPPTLMVNGFMLQAQSNVDLASGLISGGAAVWYVFAVRTAGSRTFTLAVNTSSSESPNQRLIGQVYWDGSSLGAINCYFSNTTLPVADYDSGWFAVTSNTTYTKNHGLGANPRLVVLYHSTDSAGSSEWVQVTVVANLGTYDAAVLGTTSTSILISTGTSDTCSTVYSNRRGSTGGYYRVFAWL